MRNKAVLRQKTTVMAAGALTIMMAGNALPVLAFADNAAQERSVVQGSSAAQKGQVIQVSKNVRLGGSLYELVFDANTHQVLVADAGGRDEGAQSYLYRLDAKTLEVMDRIALEQQIHGLAIDQQRNTVYMVNTRGGTLIALDTKSGKEKKSLTLVEPSAREGDKRPPQPRLAAIDEDSGLVYITGVADEGVVWVVNGEDMTLANTFENVGSRPAGLALDTEHQRIYVTLLGDNQVAAIDTSSGEVVKTFELAVEGAINVALDRGRHRLLVTGQKSGELEVLDADSGESIKRVATGEGALDVDIDESAGRVYVTNRGAGTVSVLDAENLDEVTTLETGPHPNSIAIDPEHHAAFVTNRASREAPGDERGNSVTLISP